MNVGMRDIISLWSKFLVGLLSSSYQLQQITDQTILLFLSNNNKIFTL